VPEKDEQPTLGEVKRIESPKGIDLHPDPPTAIRVSRRAMGVGGSLAVLVLVGYAYGGCRRQADLQTEAVERDVKKNVSPASTAGIEFTKEIPAGNVPMARRETEPAPSPSIQDLRAPSDLYAYGTGPIPGMAPANERVVVRQAPHRPAPAAAPAPVAPQPTEEERRLAAAIQGEREAMLAPTAVRGAMVSAARVSGMPNASDDISRIAELTKALGGPKSNLTPDQIQRAIRPGNSEPDENNDRERKEAFLSSVRSKPADGYLQSLRVAPISRFEIKAGWEIPAILEQGLNSDLPGEIKALVTSNVYDTATGIHLLVPQGSRLVGVYDSHVAYGQDGVQVAWTRIIFPDASSIDLNGMAGMDAQGNSGLREKVDRHYKRLFGMAVLSSMFAVAFELTQQRNRTVLTLPSVQETAGATVGREIGQIGAQITRRNLNVQPTIKVPAGYKFTVRVNRDIVFEGPYEPLVPPGETTPAIRAQK
jgi:type IV secretion system protein VirB10